jgi:NADPH2:quinone reductase
MAHATMRAVRMHRHGGPEEMIVDEIPVPQPAPTQVLIRVHAAGVNWADAHRRRGMFYPQPTVLPFTMGGEFAGVIEAVGAEVSRFREGDAVFALHNGGGYAEYAVAEESALIAAPAGLDPALGVALVVQGLSAVAILKDCARLQPRESVFVQAAAGGVGLLAVQLAKIYGAGTVIASASTEEKRAVTREHGADVAVDCTADGWAEEAREALGGSGVDVVLEMTGGEVFAKSLDLLADFGRMVVYGLASGEGSPMRLDHHIGRNIAVRTFYLEPYLSDAQFRSQTMAELASFVTDGRLTPVVGGRYPLEEAHELHRRMEARATFAKLLVVP